MVEAGGPTRVSVAESVEARGCEAQRRALQALPRFETPCVKIMLSLLRSNRCLGAAAREHLR